MYDVAIAGDIGQQAQLVKVVHHDASDTRLDGKLKLLVSTNLTSRGIDVPAVAHVINYDIPEQVEEYVHRIGRTARMGREGTAVTFVAEWDIEFFDAIREHVGADKLQEIHLKMYGSGDPVVPVTGTGPRDLGKPEAGQD